MKRILLTQGQYALVDDEDYDKLSEHKWYACYQKHVDSYYATRKASTDKNEKRKTIWIHRKIMNCPKGMQIDHVNHDTLDNRKENLRICTNQQNTMNQLPTKNSSSRYKGVGWIKSRKKWQAQIRIGGELKGIGDFKSEIEAARAYNEKAKELFGKFAFLNEV